MQGIETITPPTTEHSRPTCPHCGPCDADPRGGGLSGLPLVACAFLVFILPLGVATVCASAAIHRGLASGWAILAAAVGWGITVVVARLATECITRRVGRAGSGNEGRTS